MGCLGGARRYQGVSRVYSASETAQVELESGRVLAQRKRFLWDRGCT